MRRAPFPADRIGGAKENAAAMDEAVHVTLIANAGVLLQYDGVTLMLDGVYGREGHPFSNLRPDTWSRMLRGEAPFEKLDYLLFSHAHPDHFSPDMTVELLRHRRVKGVFLPDSRSVAESGLPPYLRESGLPCVMLSAQTDHASFHIEPHISVQAFSTRHLDKKFQGVHHFCYLLTFGEKRLLFTADVDYTQETFAPVRSVPLRAVFVNPLFFSDLRRGRFFHGELNTQCFCIYHIPFSEDDGMRMRPALAHELVEWPAGKPEPLILCDAFQHIEL